MKKTILAMATAALFAAPCAIANDAKLPIDNTIELAYEVDELSSFCKAIIKGDVETVKKLIDLGEDVNQKSLGKAPIHFAARYNKPEVLKLLIANGADLKKKCDDGYTAKKYAELSNAMEAMAVLKEAMKK